MTDWPAQAIRGIASLPLPNGSNDTAAVQAFINANAGKLIFCAPGTYALDNITLPANTHLHVELGTTITRRANGNLFTPGGGNVIISGGGVVNLAGGSFTGHGIVLGNTGETIDGLTIVSTPATYNSIQASSSTNTVVKNCNTDSHIIAFNTQQVKIHDNWCGGEVSVNWTGGGEMLGVWVERNLVTTTVSGSNECIVIHTQGTSLVHIHDVHCNNNMAISALNNNIIGISLPGLQDFECVGNYCDVAGSGTMSLGYELASCQSGSISNNQCRNAPTGMICHDSYNLTFAHNNVAVPGVAGAKAYLTYSDATRGVKNIIWHHNQSQHVTGFATEAYRTEQNGASGSIDGVFYDGNVVDGASAVNDTSAFTMHIGSGTISNLEFTHNRMRNCDVLFEFGAVANVRLVDNTFTGAGRNLIWQSGSAPTGQRFMENNTWNWATSAPSSGYFFIGCLVRNLTPTNVTGTVFGWLCVATTPTFRSVVTT